MFLWHLIWINEMQREVNNVALVVMEGKKQQGKERTGKDLEFQPTISRCVTEGDEWRGEITVAQLGSH